MSGKRLEHTPSHFSATHPPAKPTPTPVAQPLPWYHPTTINLYATGSTSGIRLQQGQHRYYAQANERKKKEIYGFFDFHSKVDDSANASQRRRLPYSDVAKCSFTE